MGWGSGGGVLIPLFSDLFLLLRFLISSCVVFSCNGLEAETQGECGFEFENGERGRESGGRFVRVLFGT